MKDRIASNVSAYRKLKGMTQEELAERSGVTSRTIQRIESGQVLPQSYTLTALANCLDVAYEDLTASAEPNGSSVAKLLQVPTGLLAAMHIAPLIGIYLPLTNVLVPLIFWLFKKDDHPIFDEQGRKLINFQLTLSIMAGFAMITMVLFFPVGYPWLMSCYIFAITMAVYNLARVLKHRTIFYPLSIRFLKPRSTATD